MQRFVSMERAQDTKEQSKCRDSCRQSGHRARRSGENAEIRVSRAGRRHEGVVKVLRFVSVERAQDTKEQRKCGCTCQQSGEKTRRSSQSAEIRVSGAGIGHEEVEKMQIYVSAERGEDTKEQRKCRDSCQWSGHRTRRSGENVEIRVNGEHSRHEEVEKEKEMVFAEEE